MRYTNIITLIFLVSLSYVTTPASAQFYDTTFFKDGDYNYLKNVTYHNKVRDGVLLACTVTDHVPGIIKIDRDGQMIWSTFNVFQESSFGNNFRKFSVFDDKHIYGAARPKAGEKTKSFIWKLDTSDGSVLWRTPFYVSDKREIEITEYDSTTFLVGYFLNDFAHIALMSKATGDTISTQQIGYKLIQNREEIEISVDDNKNVYVSFQGSLIKFNKNDFSQIIWQRRFEGDIQLDFVHELVIDHYGDIYLMGRDGDYFGAGSGIMYRVDPENGSTIWAKEVSGGELTVIDYKDFNDNFIVAYRHAFVGSTTERFVTVKLDKQTGTRAWYSNHEITPYGTKRPTSGIQSAGISIDLDCNGDIYATGYYGSPNSGPGQWGTLKLNGNTGKKIFDFTITNFPAIYDELSTGLGSFVFNDTLRILGKAEVANRGVEIIYAKIDPYSGTVVGKSHIDDGIQNYSYTGDIQSVGDTILVLKQIGERVQLEAHNASNQILWTKTFDEGNFISAGQFVVDQSYIYISSIRKTTDATPPQPDRLYIHKLNIKDGKTIDSVYKPLADWGYRLLEIEAKNDSCFVFYKDADNVMTIRWTDSVLTNPLVLEKANSNYNFPVRYNLAHDVGDSIAFVGNESVLMIDKVGFTLEKRFQFLNNTKHVFSSRLGTNWLVAGSTNGNASLTLLNNAFTDSIWHRTYSGNMLYSVAQDSQGTLYPTGVYNRDLLVYQLNKVGQKQWSYTMSRDSANSIMPYDMVINKKGTYISVGGSITYSNRVDALLLILDNNGDSLGQFTLNDQLFGESKVTSLELVADTSIWIGGAWNRHPCFEGFLFKLANDSLYKTASIDKLLEKFNFVIYPNPTSDFISVYGNSDIPFEYIIYDIMGRKIQQSQFPVKDNTIDVKSLLTGSYILTLRTHNGTSTYKFIVQQ
ncbi:MAG: hypothetical protein ACI9JN_000643 [Bacteroidia bacterium]|jgi:hypothetical protein